MSDPVAPTWTSFDLARLAEQRAAGGAPYLRFLAVPTLEAGIYALPAGGDDRQEPHAEDEIYFVARGRARFRAAGEVSDVAPGTVLYVKAGVPHRFEDIREPLEVLVVFAADASP